MIPRRELSSVAGCYRIYADGAGARLDGLEIELTPKAVVYRPLEWDADCSDPGAIDRGEQRCATVEPGWFHARGSVLKPAMRSESVAASWAHLTNGYVVVQVGFRSGGYEAEAFCLKPNDDGNLVGRRARLTDAGTGDYERSTTVLKREPCGRRLPVVID